jgi:hypothetical protein
MNGKPPLPDCPVPHSEVLEAKRQFKLKGERVLHDPIYRSTLPTDWWQVDLKHIRDLEERAERTSRLDPWKFSVELSHEDTYDQRFRFRDHAVERQFWIENLPKVEHSDSRLQRWLDCGRDAWVYRDPETDDLRIQSTTCKLRVCPVCRRRYQGAAVARIRTLLQDAPPRTWQFITLTIRHSRAPLKLQCDTLKASFRRLRQRKTWKSAIDHGYAVMEVTYNQHKDEWHPHLHVLAHCRYVNWHALRQDWIAVTAGSSVIDCGYVHSVGSACDYVAKYLGKPPSLDVLPNDARVSEYYTAISNARWLMPFGSPPRPESTLALDKPRKFLPLGPLTQFWVAARRGDQDACRVLRKLVHAETACSAKTCPEHRHRLLDAATHYDPTDPFDYTPP